MDVERRALQLERGLVSGQGADQAVDAGKEAEQVERGGKTAERAVGAVEDVVGLEQPGALERVPGIEPGAPSTNWKCRGASR